jgi:hypothetical protein
MAEQEVAPGMASCEPLVSAQKMLPTNQFNNGNDKK